MNYLITGGCGFIGVNLIYALLNFGETNEIRIVDNLSTGKKEHLYSVLEDFEHNGNYSSIRKGKSKIEVLVGDISDEELAARACHNVDVVVHLAANTGVIPSIENPMADCISNVIGTLNYLEASKNNRVKCFIHASSGAVLGEQIPPIHEKMVPYPISPYGASKLSGEAYCSAYHGAFGLNTIVLRFGNVYGPHSYHKGSVVAKFIKHIMNNEPLPIYGDGTQTRDFIYIVDLVKAIICALQQKHVGGQVFQIATHKEHTVEEIADELNNLSEKYLYRKNSKDYMEKREGEVQRNYSDISKAKKLLNFYPNYNLKKGLHETFKWFLSKEGKDQ